MSLTNSLSGVNLAAISQETAKTLLPLLSGLKYFTLDLSNDIAEKGASVTTRVVTAYAAADLSSGYSTAVSNTTTTAVTVTLNSQYGVVLGFTDAQISQSSVNLEQMVYEPFANAAAKAIYSLIFSLITTSNFTLVTTVASASFDSDHLSDVATTLNKAYVPLGRRGFICNSDVANALRKDTSFKAAYASGTTETILGGTITRGMGFDIVEISWLPTNSENLTAFGSAPQAVAFAARRLADPTDWYGAVENITIADVPIQFRLWYDGNAGVKYLSMAALFGASAGVTQNLCRVASA